MANAATLLSSAPVRLLIQGPPKTAKTSSLIGLINAGFKLRVLDYDGNFMPVLKMADPARLQNVDVRTLEDSYRWGEKTVETTGAVTAAATGLRMITDRWKYKDEITGEEIDLGVPREWDDTHVVVLDSLTALGTASLNKARAIANRGPLDTRDSDYGVAMGIQETFIDILRAKKNRFHLIVISHTKIFGPKEIRKGEDDITTAKKRAEAEFIPTRLVPSALGRDLPPRIPGKFESVLVSEKEVTGSKARYYLNPVAGGEIDSAIPVPELQKRLDNTTALMQIFSALSPASVAKVQAGLETPAKETAA